MLERDQFEALIDKCPPSVRQLVNAAIWTGARQSELLGLRQQDVDLKEGRLSITAQLSRAKVGYPAVRVEPKTQSAVRVIELRPGLVAHLKRHREERLALGLTRPEDGVFGTQTGQPLYYRNMTTAFERAVKAAKLNGTVFHDLRHTHASILISAGVSPTYVAQRLGHGSPAITMSVYARLFGAVEHGQAAMASLEALS